jgi:hypothetical protein
VALEQLQEQVLLLVPLLAYRLFVVQSLLVLALEPAELVLVLAHILEIEVRLQLLVLE